MNVLGRFRWQTLTAACPNERDTIGKVRETSSNGVMEEGSGKVHRASTYLALHKRETYIGNVSETSSNGVMDERSGKVHKASTHDADDLHR